MTELGRIHRDRPEGGLVRLRDKDGRSWLLPVVPNPLAYPDGWDADPEPLDFLEGMAGPLVVTDFKVVRMDGRDHP